MLIKIYFLVLLFLIISISEFHTSAFADSSNPTKQFPMFSSTVGNSKSNTYQDITKHFSISPPQSWTILKNIPTSMQSNALVTFTNNNNTGLATFSIYYKPISQQVIDVLNTVSDRDIFYDISKELSYNGTDSQTYVSQVGIQRYSDGAVIKAISLTRYTNDTTMIQNEHLIFFLNDDREYTLLLASNPQDFNQNQISFETAADTFYVAPKDNSTQSQSSNIIPPVPEFGSLTGMIIVISIIGVMIISRRFRLDF